MLFYLCVILELVVVLTELTPHRRSEAPGTVDDLVHNANNANGPCLNLESQRGASA